MNIRCAFLIPAPLARIAELFALVLLPLSAALAQDSSVLTYHGDNSRSGQYVVPALSWDKARSLQLDRTFDARVAGAMYAQPLYWRPSGANSGTLFVVTGDDVVQAFDAISGKEIWRREVG